MEEENNINIYTTTTRLCVTPLRNLASSTYNTPNVCCWISNVSRTLSSILQFLVSKSIDLFKYRFSSTKFSESKNNINLRHRSNIHWTLTNSSNWIMLKSVHLPDALKVRTIFTKPSKADAISTFKN